jgi:hypothetical protein
MILAARGLHHGKMDSGEIIRPGGSTMKKSINVAPKKRGRPRTGNDRHMAARMPPALIAEVEA